jgi:hypothetical protein
MPSGAVPRAVVTTAIAEPFLGGITFPGNPCLLFAHPGSLRCSPLAEALASLANALAQVAERRAPLARTVAQPAETLA